MKMVLMVLMALPVRREREEEEDLLERRSVVIVEMQCTYDLERAAYHSADDVCQCVVQRAIKSCNNALLFSYRVLKVMKVPPVLLDLKEYVEQEENLEYKYVLL